MRAPSRKNRRWREQRRHHRANYAPTGRTTSTTRNDALRVARANTRAFQVHHRAYRVRAGSLPEYISQILERHRAQIAPKECTRIQERRHAGTVNRDSTPAIQVHRLVQAVRVGSSHSPTGHHARTAQQACTQIQERRHARTARKVSINLGMGKVGASRAVLASSNKPKGSHRACRVVALMIQKAQM